MLERPADDSSSSVRSFRIRPEQVSALLHASRVGSSGETYAVDAEGRMVTETRFPEQVAGLGLVPAEAKGRTTALLEVRDPGRPLEAGQAHPTPQKTWPLTWAVAEAVARRNGVNARGYRDYRGVPVEAARRYRERLPAAEIVLGGGVRGQDDLRALARAGYDAALVGTALHTGVLTRADLALRGDAS